MATQVIGPWRLDMRVWIGPQGLPPGQHFYFWIGIGDNVGGAISVTPIPWTRLPGSNYQHRQQHMLVHSVNIASVPFVGPVGGSESHTQVHATYQNCGQNPIEGFSIYISIDSP
ncbi:hypothetical protein PRN20_03325 [Devosia sp. ZB163]|uniref:hypothetical protein n=1 Tax=Devosia sp. ZB163 TaxID=3025938 RepID=UPI00236044FE|nr:hypothetical protein [Devosia sp. ZB163]MDC9822755.1 hypothetical protein [Devosia sp. ZB163]